jgi:hypothetical protein
MSTGVLFQDFEILKNRIEFPFSATRRIPAPTDESPNLTTLVIFFLPLGDVNDNEKCENRARKAYLDGKPSRIG